MSADGDPATAAAAVSSMATKCCASCGIAAIDDIQLKQCPHCDLEYCSDECQREHREEHEAACKKRAAELYEELLFRQPEGNHFGDCPICCLPMPNDPNRSSIYSCCSQVICRGCVIANQDREIKQRQKGRRCPFCRHLLPRTDEEIEKRKVERAKLNDPIALHSLGAINYERDDYESAFHYYSKAAALGDVQSMFNLSIMYRKGEGVEEDMDKERALLEKAAIAGHPDARYNLGCDELEDGRFDRAVAHWIIAANLGNEDSIKELTKCYKDGYVSKDDFAAALRANQSAVDATESLQRVAAELFWSM